MNHTSDRVDRLGRRAFLKDGVLLLGAASLLHVPAASGATLPEARPKVRFGLITDLHYADRPPAGTRHYRETPAKLAEAARHFAEARPDFVVELGDLIAADSVKAELAHLDRID